jgi:hypothetical protein
MKAVADGAPGVTMIIEQLGDRGESNVLTAEEYKKIANTNFTPLMSGGRAMAMAAAAAPLTSSGAAASTGGSALAYEAFGDFVGLMIQAEILPKDMYHEAGWDYDTDSWIKNPSRKNLRSMQQI